MSQSSIPSSSASSKDDMECPADANVAEVLGHLAQDMGLCPDDSTGSLPIVTATPDGDDPFASLATPASPTPAPAKPVAPSPRLEPATTIAVSGSPRPTAADMQQQRIPLLGSALPSITDLADSSAVLGIGSTDSVIHPTSFAPSTLASSNTASSTFPPSDASNGSLPLSLNSAESSQHDDQDDVSMGNDLDGGTSRAASVILAAAPVTAATSVFDLALPPSPESVRTTATISRTPINLFESPADTLGRHAAAAAAAAARLPGSLGGSPTAPALGRASLEMDDAAASTVQRMPYGMPRNRSITPPHAHAHRPPVPPLPDWTRGANGGLSGSARSGSVGTAPAGKSPQPSGFLSFADGPPSSSSLSSPPPPPPLLSSATPSSSMPPSGPAGGVGSRSATPTVARRIVNVPAVPPFLTPCIDPISADEYEGIVDSVRDAIQEDAQPMRIGQGSSGSYFCRNTDGQILGVFKPKDEEPYGELNPKWQKWIHRNVFFCCFGRSCLIPNVGYLSEAGASLLDERLGFGIVPVTKVVALSSPAFYYKKKHRRHPAALPLKVGSFQLFLRGFKDASMFLKLHPLPNEPPAGSIVHSLKRGPVVTAGTYNATPARTAAANGMAATTGAAVAPPSSAAAESNSLGRAHSDSGELEGGGATMTASTDALLSRSPRPSSSFQAETRINIPDDNMAAAINEMPRNFAAAESALPHSRFMSVPEYDGIWDAATYDAFVDQFQRLTILDYLMRNTDRGLDNWMIAFKNGRLQVAAIDHGLAFPFKHPDKWRSYPYGWLYLQISKIPYLPSLSNHVRSLLRDTRWWRVTRTDMHELFAQDEAFDADIFEAQMAVIRGQMYNMLQVLEAGGSPWDLWFRTPIIVVRQSLPSPPSAMTAGSPSARGPSGRRHRGGGQSERVANGLRTASARSSMYTYSAVPAPATPARGGGAASSGGGTGPGTPAAAARNSAAAQAVLDDDFLVAGEFAEHWDGASISGSEVGPGEFGYYYSSHDDDEDDDEYYDEEDADGAGGYYDAHRPRQQNGACSSGSAAHKGQRPRSMSVPRRMGRPNDPTSPDGHGHDNGASAPRPAAAGMLTQSSLLPAPPRQIRSTSDRGSRVGPGRLSPSQQQRQQQGGLSDKPGYHDPHHRYHHRSSHRHGGRSGAGEASSSSMPNPRAFPDGRGYSTDLDDSYDSLGDPNDVGDRVRAIWDKGKRRVRAGGRSLVRKAKNVILETKRRPWFENW